MINLFLLVKNSLQNISKIFVIIVISLVTNCCSKVNPQIRNSNNKTQTQVSSNNYQIQAFLATNSHSIDPNFMCFSANPSWIKSWHDSDLWQGINQLNPRMLRFPGGTESQYWDWRRGKWIEDLNNINHPYIAQVFRGLEAEGGYRGKLEDLKATLKATNTIPLFVLNILTSDLNSQLEMLRQSRDLGIPVKYIQIGNEPYLGFGDNLAAFPTPQDYAVTATKWILAIKQEFPDVKIAIIGIDPITTAKATLWGQSRLQHWNNTIVNQALPEADAIAIQIYHGHGLDSSISPSANYPFFTSEEVPLVLGIPFRNWRNIQIKSIPKNKELWIAEYNLFSSFHNPRKRKPRIIGSWTHGLYTMTMSLLFLEEQRISNICNHVLVGDSSFGAILADEDMFINPSQEVSATKLGLTATGSALRLLGDATEGMSEARQINFTNSPHLRGHNNFRYPALYGWMFSNGQDSKALIMNLSNQNLEINLSSLFNQTVNFEQIYAEPRVLVTGPGILNQQKGKISQQATLPFYSITLLSTN